jgi:hypothetical protein
MSTFYIRQKAEAWATALIATVPYYPTINQNQDPSDDMWMTLEFQTFGATKETYCDDFVDDGEIILTFFGRVGLGYAPQIQTAEAYAALFFANTDVTGQLVLTSMNPPVDFVGQNNPWYIVEVAFNYQYRGI